MAFITDEDHILLMDPLLPDDGGEEVRLRREDLCRCRDAGIKTVLNFVPWNQIEYEPGEFDWSYVESRLADARFAGIKTLLMTYDEAIDWAPPDWYLQTDDGLLFNSDLKSHLISPWNPDARSYSDAFIRRVIKQYSGPDVCCICSFSREGEWLLPPYHYAYFDSHACRSFRNFAKQSNGGSIHKFNRTNRTRHTRWSTVQPLRKCVGDTRDWLKKSLVDYVVAQQKLFAPAHEEIWMMVSRGFGWEAGTFCLDEIYEALRQRVKATLYGIQFVHFPYGRSGEKTLEDQRTHGVQVFAGSEWAEGLRQNTPLAIRQRLRGLVTSPLHRLNGHSRLEKWMVDAFSASVAALSGHRAAPLRRRTRTCRRKFASQ